jgi:hypothetical protein
MLNHATAISFAAPARPGSTAGRPAGFEQDKPDPTGHGEGLFTASAGVQPVINTTCDESGRPLTTSLLAWAPDVGLV